MGWYGAASHAPMKGELEGEAGCAGSAVADVTVRMRREEGVTARFDILMAKCCRRCGLVFGDGDADGMNPRIENLS